MRKPPVRVAIIGAGNMAGVHATQFQSIRGCKVVAVVEIDPIRRENFATCHGIPHSFADLSELLEWDEFDAVAVVTPDTWHTPVSIPCLAKRKHVLCEKPLALNYTDAKKMVAAAKRAGVVNMVNFSYRDWPAIQAVASLVRRGGIGEIRHVEASYLQAWLVSRIWGDWRKNSKWLWRLSSRHGSQGALGDVGVHIIDFAMYPVGPIASLYCRLKTFPKAPNNYIGEYILDANDSALLNVEFENGAVGTIHTTRWCGGHANRLFLRISGTLGTVEIDSDRGVDVYRICRGRNLHTCQWKDIKASPVPTIYQRFIRAILTGRTEQPDFECGAAVQKVLDTCFESNARQAPISLGSGSKSSRNRSKTYPKAKNTNTAG